MFLFLFCFLSRVVHFNLSPVQAGQHQLTHYFQPFTLNFDSVCVSVCVCVCCSLEEGASGQWCSSFRWPFSGGAGDGDGHHRLADHHCDDDRNKPTAADSTARGHYHIGDNVGQQTK